MKKGVIDNRQEFESYLNKFGTKTIQKVLTPTGLRTVRTPIRNRNFDDNSVSLDRSNTQMKDGGVTLVESEGSVKVGNGNGMTYELIKGINAANDNNTGVFVNTGTVHGSMDIEPPTTNTQSGGGSVINSRITDRGAGSGGTAKSDENINPYANPDINNTPENNDTPPDEPRGGDEPSGGGGGGGGTDTPDDDTPDDPENPEKKTDYTLAIVGAVVSLVIVVFAVYAKKKEK